MTDVEARRLPYQDPQLPVGQRVEDLLSRMPLADKAGLLFLEAGHVVQPDPDRLDAYQTHAGQRRGQWPSSPDIAAAMFERYGDEPSF